MCKFVEHHGTPFLQASNGERFRLRYTGCGQGIAVFAGNGDFVTAVEINATENREHLIETLCAAVTSIIATRWLKNNEKRLETLKEDIAAKMKEQGIEGELFVEQPVSH
jgi:hypothetical protein